MDLSKPKLEGNPGWLFLGTLYPTNVVFSELIVATEELFSPNQSALIVNLVPYSCWWWGFTYTVCSNLVLYGSTSVKNESTLWCEFVNTTSKVVEVESPATSTENVSLPGLGTFLRSTHNE